MRIRPDVKLDYDDVLLVPQTSEVESRSEVSLVRELVGHHSQARLRCMPVMITNMLSVGSFSTCRALSTRDPSPFVCLHKYYETDEIIKFIETSGAGNFVYSMGISVPEVNKLREIVAKTGYPPSILIDTPNGYMKKFLDFVKHIRDVSPTSYLIAGNVCTPSAAENLSLAGADAVRVGIGSGRQCRTRMVTGCGFPQLSAISEAAHVAHGFGTHLVADGGITNIGDLAKAFGAGADIACIGSLAAGYQECDHEWKTDEEGEYTEFFGLSSNKAQQSIYGKLENHRASEGRVTKIRKQGSIHDLFREIEGGLRSACAYIGAKKIKDMPKCAEFVRVNRTHNSSMDKQTVGY